MPTTNDHGHLRGHNDSPNVTLAFVSVKRFSFQLTIVRIDRTDGIVSFTSIKWFFSIMRAESPLNTLIRVVTQLM